MAELTAGTYLMYKGIEEEPMSYTALCPITSYPDMGAVPSKIDTTDLSALVFKTSINGLQDIDNLQFEANYTKAEFDKIKALAGKTYAFELQFGESGANGKFDWQGQIVVFPTGGGVDEARKMTITISVETEIKQGV